MKPQFAAILASAVLIWGGEAGAIEKIGPCGQDGYLAYRAVSGDLSDIAACQIRDFADAPARERILTPIAEETFEPGTTYFLADHGSTQELFVESCADRKCTIEEMVAAEQACLRKHWGDCSMVAAVDDTETYCLIGE